MHLRTLTLSPVVLATAFALTACGGSDQTTTAATGQATTTASESSTQSSTTASGGETVKLGETEFSIDPKDTTVKAGSVTFDVSNDGSTVHNLEIEGGGLSEEASTGDIQPGASGQVTVDLKPGTYEMYCGIDGHRGLGMEGEITVQ